MNTRTSRRFVVSMLLFLIILLITPSIVWARPMDEGIQEWRNEVAEASRLPTVAEVITEAVHKAIASVEDELVANADGSDVRPESEWECIGSRIGDVAFWIPDSCFSEGLNAIISYLGTNDLWCERGYMGPQNEITVSVKEQPDWVRCLDFKEN